MDTAESSKPASRPGRPREASSRQQTEPDQTLDSGSPELDREATRKGGGNPVPTIPPGTK